MVDGGRPLEVLDQILEQYKVVQHGVSMYFGSADPLNREHLKRLKRLARRTKTPWLSDHLCWGSRRRPLHPRPAAHALHLGSSRGDRAEDPPGAGLHSKSRWWSKTSRSYAEFHASEMTEWEFLNEVVERADCGILLDVNNIYVSSKNHSFDPFTYVNAVPAHRVAQIHIAGHSKFEKYILDTHDHPVLPAVWRLYARAIERCGPTATLLEWDDNIPTFDEVHAEALKANKFLKAAAEAAPETAQQPRTRWSPAAERHDERGCGVSRPVRRAARRARPAGQLAGDSAAHGRGGHASAHAQRNACRAAARWRRRIMREADAIIRPNDRLTSFERLEIYNRQYWFRLYSCFEEDFPGLQAILGRAQFRCADAGLSHRLPVGVVHAAEPWLAARSVARAAPEHLGPHPSSRCDMVRLEWAHIEAFDSEERPRLSAEKLCRHRRKLDAAAAAVSARAGAVVSSR